MSDTCKNCGNQFDYSKAQKHASVHGIKAPQFCRLCSWQKKLSFENEYNVYKRKCDATGKTIVSVYKENAHFPVYERNYWMSDDWDLPELNYDPNKSFFEQYFELSKLAPRPNVNCVNAENSEYAHLVFDSRNCYLSFQVFLCDKVIGCYRVVRVRDSVNSFFCSDSELLCECANCHKGYNLSFCEDCEDCSDSAFLFDCKGCRNCFMSYNLRGKQYYFKNEKLSKQQYQERVKEYNLTNLEGRQKAKMEFESLRKNFIVKASHQINCENCFGDYLVGCKGCEEIYFSDGCEDSCDILRGTEDTDSFDAVVGGKIELCYNVLQPGYSYKCSFGISCNHCNETHFSEYCDFCDDCIGCISLKRGKFCILNKKYSEEEYKKLKEHIFAELSGGIGQMAGAEAFFDPAKSPFAYEETIADLYFPKSNFSDQKKFNEVGKCDYCGRGLSLSEAEEGLYKKMNVATAKTCFNCRIQSLARPYSAVVMEKAKCSSCGKEVFKGKSARDFGRLYCEECYLKEVY